jgi:7-keto-8-aminopelargonate synthetase-like enzyme
VGIGYRLLAIGELVSAFDQELSRRLAAIRARGLHRELRRVDSAQSPRLEIAGRRLLNFSSNDYLGLANDPALKTAALKAVEQYGAGAGASRLICGSLAPHHELEETLAQFKATEAALAFSSGYAAALGTITALLDKADVIIVDKLVHACLVDAARLCGATLRVFRHNDLEHLEDILRWADQRRRPPCPSVPGPCPSFPAVAEPSGQRQPRTLVVTESVFSMDGDQAPLPQIVELKDKYGAWLMLDEAHATGLYGAKRRGLAEALNVAHRIEVQMGTLGKALGAAGGFICGSRVLIDFLVNRARSFIFSTAPVPAAAAAASAGVKFVQSDAGRERCARLWERVSQFANARAASGRASDAGAENPDPGTGAQRTARPTAMGTQPATGPAAPSTLPSAIIPIIIGPEAEAVAAAAALLEQGIFVPAIRYPTVARGRARLRVTLTAAHTAEEVAQLAAALAKLG